MKEKTPNVANQILMGSKKSGKTYTFSDDHHPEKPAQIWFQESEEGLVLFVVFYTQACRWSRCLGCNLPSISCLNHIDYKALVNQIDHLFSMPEVVKKREKIKKLIVSNNGSILDEVTFSSSALMYLMVRANMLLPNLSVVCLETRPEFVDLAELEFLARALEEGDTPTRLEIAIGFEAFDSKVRNEVFNKGLELSVFERFVRDMAEYDFRIKTYFMQKPVPDMSDEEGVTDIGQAVGYLSEMARDHNVSINMHLNPTYVARGTRLVESFNQGRYAPPRLIDVARAALHGDGTPISIFIGLYDEGLAVPGGSFIREGDDLLITEMEKFNRSQDYGILRRLVKQA